MDSDELDVYISHHEQIQKESDKIKYDKFEFVKPLNKITNYMQDQKELVDKARDIAKGDPLNTLKYIVSCFAHEGENIEFVLVINAPTHMSHNKQVIINLPIITCSTSKEPGQEELEDRLGFYVSWGDGILTYNETQHIYTKNNDYEIRIFGLGITGFGTNKSINFKLYLTKVISFGNLGHKFTSLEHAFRSCKNLKSIPSNIPSSITNLSYTFSHITNFNLPLETWDTCNVINMSFMFYKCYEFNQPLGTWDTRNVTNMSCMFGSCHEFNQPLGNWNTRNVTNMLCMFYECNNFDQPLGNWETCSVINMHFMFSNCYKFNQPLTEWNTCNVTDMSFMFNNCSEFNQSLTKWNTCNVTNMSFMFGNCHITEKNKPVMRMFQSHNAIHNKN